MIKQEVSKEKIDHLIADANYLLDEAEALKYVIGGVPYAETPAGGMSIFNRLRLIDHAQINYYRPVIEKVFSENRRIKLQSIEHYLDTFEEKPDEDADIEKVLRHIIKHRAGVINLFGKISLIDWERVLNGEGNQQIQLFEFAEQMISGERKLLKEIADLVLIYQNEREQQRQIHKKAEKHPNRNNPNV